ncbi:MATE family efflux transporter [Lutibacter sp. HS1-25]|uniref:MATE family efflux transporter n=1 Tax=Lutibacter sp. HS1-25 TaxID=2485000 RepID=UPI0010119A6B|nr:MATE family efflux transporter [Lutibacter sp. HS1-25]RXP64474.1 MATE family efflux transporter [Lutibacter sp. HS1-25]
MHKTSNISFKAINKLAIPAIISGIAEPLLSITDTAIVGNIQQHPTEALAAVGIAGSFISALVWILAQTRSAISATVGKYLGAKKLNEIDSLPAQIIGFNIVASVLIYFVTLFFAEEIFQLYNANGLILNYSVEYFKIRAIGFPLTLFVFSVFGVFGGLQNTFWPMVISMVGAGLNIALDFVLVFGIDGYLAPMNIVGAAWASVIAQMVMAVLAFILLLKKTPFSLKFSLPFNKEFKKLLTISLNLAIRAASLNVALYLANSFATKYGDNYIAAQTIAFQIWLFFAFFIDGYASVGNIVSGKLLGEQNYKKLWKLSIKLCKYAVSVAIILVLICVLFYFPIGRLFSKNQLVLQSFYGIFWIVLLMQPINAIAFVFDGIFKGLAEAATLRNLLIFATFFGFLPVLLVSDYFDLKLNGIWLAFFVWMIIRGSVLVGKFRKNYLHKNT